VSPWVYTKREFIPKGSKNCVGNNQKVFPPGCSEKNTKRLRNSSLELGPLVKKTCERGRLGKDPKGGRKDRKIE